MQSILSTKSIYQLLENTGFPIEGHYKRRIVFNNYSIAGGIEYVLLETGLYMLTVDLALKETALLWTRLMQHFKANISFLHIFFPPRFDYLSPAN